MRKRTKVLLLVGALGALAALTATITRPSEPQYNGYPLSYWVYSAHSTDNLERQQAVEAITNLGTNALPFLISYLRYEANGASLWFSSILARAPKPLRWPWLVDWAGGKEGNRRAEFATQMLPVLAGVASPALPDLARIAKDPTRPNAAARAQRALANMGKEAVPYLLAVLQDTNTPGRYGVAAMIVIDPRRQTDDASAVPTLVHCLQEPDIRLQTYAAYALGRIALEPRTAVPALIQTAKAATDPGLRYACIAAFADFGDDARDAIPLLQSALLDPNANLRAVATNALGRIAPEALNNAPTP
jgi:hypothetical protein